MKKLIIVAVVAIVMLIGLALLVSLLAAGTDSTPNLAFSKRVAVIPIKGEIASEVESFSNGFSSEEIVEKLEDAENDSTVGSILLDIDSPGGSVVATRQIVYKLRKLTKKKVSWIGDIGASGAYYVAAASDHIVADADSITGSIGVVSYIPGFTGLMEKLGVDMNVVKMGEKKTTASPFKKFTEDDKALLENLLKGAYERFKADIQSFRGSKLKQSTFAVVSDGRIISGQQALEFGLIDQLGTRDDAISKAAEFAGVSGKPELKTYKKKEITFFDLLTEAGASFGRGLRESLLANESSNNFSIKT